MIQISIMFASLFATQLSARAIAQTPPVSAEYATTEQKDPGEIVYNQTVEFSDNLRARVQLTYLKNRSKAILTLRSPNDNILGELELPSWVTESRYHYQVDSGRVENFPVILFKAEPAKGGGSSDQTYSVVWSYVDAGRSGKKNREGWRLVTSTSSSFLDGGSILQLRKINGETELIRKNNEDAAVCGLGENAFDRYDPSTHSFTAQLNPEALKGATQLAAISPHPPYTPERSLPLGRFYFATSSASTGDLPTDRPQEINDGSDLTFWNEESRGLGRFQYLEARFLPGAMIQGVRIVPGAFRNQKVYNEYAYPTQLLVSTREGKQFIVDIPHVTYNHLKESGGLIIHFPQPISTTCASFVILNAQEGKKTKRNKNAEKTAITEITFLTPYYGLDRKQAAKEIVNQVITTTDNNQQKQLSYLSEGYMDEITAEVRKRLQAKEDPEQLLPLINKFPDNEAIDILVPLFKQTSPDSKNYPKITRALAAHRETAAKVLLDLYKSGIVKEPRKEIDLIRLIGRTGSDPMLLELIPEIGNGTRQLRNVVVRSVGRCSSLCMQPLLNQLGKIDPESPISYDILRTIRLVARNLPQNGRDSLNFKPLQETMLRTNSRRSLLLVLRILQQIQPPGYESALIKYLTYSRDPLVRSQAAATLGHYHSSEAHDTLLKGLKDKNPDVRIASIRALKEQDNIADYIPEVYDYSLREHWRTGLTQAYDILTQQKDPAYLTKLENQIRKNPTSERTDIILNAFAKRSYPMNFNTLATLIETPGINANIIRRAIDLLGRTNEVESLPLLIKLTKNEFAQEISPKQRRSLIGRAILAIGRLDQPESIDYLFSSLHDAPNEDYRKTILHALSFSKKESVIPRIENTLTSLSQENQQIAKSVIARIQQRIQLEKLVKDIDLPKESK